MSYKKYMEGMMEEGNDSKSDKRKMAKQRALEGLKEAMDNMSNNGLMGAKVIAKDPEGLSEGLETAKEIIDESSDDDDSGMKNKEDLLKYLKNR
jgi:hypothetical protein